MAVNEILDEIENLVVDAKHLLFTNKSLVEENDLVRLVEDLRNELPLELLKAYRLADFCALWYSQKPLNKPNNLFASGHQCIGLAIRSLSSTACSDSRALA